MGTQIPPSFLEAKRGANGGIGRMRPMQAVYQGTLRTTQETDVTDRVRENGK